MKRGKKNVIYVDFTFTKTKIKSKTLMILYKITFFLIILYSLLNQILTFLLKKKRLWISAL